MKRKLHPRPSWVRFGTVAAFILLGCALTALAQLSRSIKTRDFVYYQFYEDALSGRGQTNRLKGVLRGAEGRYLSNDLIFITRMELEHRQLDGRTNLIARAPECLFDRESQVAWSTGRLEIVGMGGAMHLYGYRGFELRMTNSTMIASNRVRTIIRQDLLQPGRP